MTTKDELEFYDIKSRAESALIDLKKNCEKTGRVWKDELDDLVCDAERA